MRRLPRIVLLLSLVAIMPVLAGCENFDPDAMDPFGWNAKKPLPGKRELLFPSGVPGVSQGIPAEYQAGYKPPPSDDLSLTGEGQQAAGTPAAQTAKSAPVKPVRQSKLTKPKAKPKPRVVKRKPKPAPQPAETASEPKGTQAPWPASPPPPQQAQSGWPAPAESQKLAPWPSAPPPGSFSK
jgi:hypothetical protein